MCAIFGSFDVTKFQELAELNSYRGQHSFSISVYDPIKKDIKLVKKDLGEFDISGVQNYMGVYWIGHIQAPTTESKSLDTVHPSVSDFSFLWHNGIIKEDCIRDMQKVLNRIDAWDTKLLHLWLEENRSLDLIDGTFSCLMYEDGEIKLFRNEISPMFVDGELNISSTKFNNAVKTKANTVLRMDFGYNELVESYSFSTKENPYYFANGV